MKKTWSELIAKYAKVGAGAAVAAAVVVGFTVADRNPRESAVVLNSIPESSASIKTSSTYVESDPVTENSQEFESRDTDIEKPYLININTATSKQLQELSGIGESKAAAIIEYRETHGSFSDISEIMNVSGIGESIFENIRYHITVGDVPPNETTSRETSTPSSTASTAPAPIPVVNINTASLEELQQLPGIGSTKAMAIVQYRSVFGDFTDIHEIKNVSGIGDSVFEGIRDYITVGNVSPRPVENDPQAPEEPEDIYVDLNTATKSELCKIPGIGSVKAQAIIDYREDNGEFYSIEEIKNVSGIGDKTFEKIRDYIFVEYRERPGDDPDPEQSEPTVNYPLNLNTATFEELCTLPHIDERMARDIIQFRIDHEGFNDIRELQHIDGIGLGLIQSLRYIITV